MNINPDTVQCLLCGAKLGDLDESNNEKIKPWAGGYCKSGARYYCIPCTEHGGLKGTTKYKTFTAFNKVQRIAKLEKQILQGEVKIARTKKLIEKLPDTEQKVKKNIKALKYLKPESEVLNKA